MTDGLFGVIRAPLLECTAAESLNNAVDLNLEFDNGVDRGSLICEQLREESNLLESAGVAVEEETGSCIRFGETVANQLVGERVGNEVAALDDLANLDAEVRAVLDVGTEDVARGDRGYTERLGDAYGLGSLTGPGGTDDEQAEGLVVMCHRRSPS